MSEAGVLLCQPCFSFIEARIRRAYACGIRDALAKIQDVITDYTKSIDAIANSPVTPEDLRK